MIGIGITTHNRTKTLLKSLDRFNRFFPAGAKLVIVDDASDHTFSWSALNAFRGEDYKDVSVHRLDTLRGIPRAKNYCIALLEECDHIFLFDDDTYPIASNWWKPYVESKEPHLMYQFKLPGKPANDMQELYRDDNIVAYSHTRGAMLYVNRSVLDVVGGFDTAYGTGMFEHTDWTNRIHNAGLTTHRAMDIPGSDKLLYCLDQDGAADSSIPTDVRSANSTRNFPIYRKSKKSKEYKEFRQ